MRATFSSQFRATFLALRLKVQTDILEDVVSSAKLGRYKKKWEDQRTKDDRATWIQKKNSRQISKDAARKMATNILGRPFHSLDPTTFLTKSELDKLKTQGNKRLMFNVLGTNGQQLQDSMTVTRDVEKFLRRNDLNRAALLAQFAGLKGGSGFDLIMKYHLSQNQVNAALDVFSDMKKRKIPLTDFTLTVLFEGCARVQTEGDKYGLSQKKGEQLKAIFDNEHKKNPKGINIRNANACLKALFNCPDANLAFAFFDSFDEYGIRPDIKTLTSLFSALKNFRDKADAVAKAEPLFEYAMKSKIIIVDAPLVGSFASVYTFSNSSRLIARGLEVLRRWFDICSPEEAKQSLKYNDVLKYKTLKPGRKDETSDNVEFLPIDSLTPDTRFPVNDVVVEMALLSYDSLRMSQEIIALFEEFAKKSNQISARMCNIYLKAKLRTGYNAEGNCIRDCLQLLDKQEKTYDFKRSTLTLSIFGPYLERYILDKKDSMFSTLMLYWHSFKGLGSRALSDFMFFATKIEILNSQQLETMVSEYCKHCKSELPNRSNPYYRTGVKEMILMDVRACVILERYKVASLEANSNKTSVFNAANRLHNSLEDYVKALGKLKAPVMETPKDSPLDSYEIPDTFRAATSGKTKSTLLDGAMEAKKDAIREFLRCSAQT